MSITEIDRDPFALAGYEGDSDKELLALIAEYWSLQRAGDKIWDEISRRQKELPPLRAAIVEIGKIIWPNGTFDSVHAENEDQIADKNHAGIVPIIRVVHNRKLPFEINIYKDRVDELLADFRAQVAENKAAYDDARKAADIYTLSDRAEEFWKQAAAVDERIDEIRPATLSGVIALLDFWDEREIFEVPDQAIAGLREIVKRENAQ
jgi:hypothetical protein